MTPNEELFAKYYNRGKLLVKDMDDSQLREHRESLQQIATEAKAQLVAADDEIRERGAKKRSGKEWLVSVEGDARSSEALNAVKTRAARMSKMDKVQRDLLAAGIDEDTVKEMVRNLERRATEKNMKTITFNKPTTEQAVVTVSTKVETNYGPFDASKLKFGA